MVVTYARSAWCGFGVALVAVSALAGAFNVTEFGSIKDPEQFRALYAYSPFANARDGTAYPAVLFTSGDNDGRVAPYESRKMTARLQAASASSSPILLRTEAAAGHGIGTALSTRIEEDADVYAFLVDQLGMTTQSATAPVAADEALRAPVTARRGPVAARH